VAAVKPLADTHGEAARPRVGADRTSRETTASRTAALVTSAGRDDDAGRSDAFVAETRSAIPHHNQAMQLRTKRDDLPLAAPRLLPRS